MFSEIIVSEATVMASVAFLNTGWTSFIDCETSMYAAGPVGRVGWAS